MISVAMAVCCGEKYLSVQIESIMEQLSEDDELIVSYDESTDATWDIITKYSAEDSRIKVLRNTKKGVTHNFDNAIRHCKGDYIYISDQDDKWTSNKVEVVQAIFEESDPDIVIHNTVDTDEELNAESITHFDKYKIGGILNDYVKPRMSGCCMAFKSEMKRYILPMPEIAGYDQWIALVCETFGSLALCDEVLIYHRIHGGNVTPQSRRAIPLIIMFRTKLLATLAERYLRLKWRRK